MSDPQYDGLADKRLNPVAAAAADDPFRKRYTALSTEKMDLHDAIKDQASALWALIDKTPVGMEQSTAKRKLREAIMWAINGLTAPDAKT